jgi:hypothetical protein
MARQSDLTEGRLDVDSVRETIKYCYKYNSWPFADRPPELPRCVACDFDTSITANVVARVTSVARMTTNAEIIHGGQSSNTKVSEEPTESE